MQIHTFFPFLFFKKSPISYFFSKIRVTYEMFKYSSKLVRIRVALLWKRKLCLRKIHDRWFMLPANAKFISRK